LFSRNSHQKGTITVWWPEYCRGSAFAELWLLRGCSDRDETRETTGERPWSHMCHAKVCFVGTRELQKYLSRKDINQQGFWKVEWLAVH
jgi:hypothetical protein